MGSSVVGGFRWADRHPPRSTVHLTLLDCRSLMLIFVFCCFCFSVAVVLVFWCETVVGGALMVIGNEGGLWVVVGVVGCFVLYFYIWLGFLILF